jgi:arabinose-5-phosphate isomerase
MRQVHDALATGDTADRLDYARQIIHGEALALEQVAQRLDESFLRAVDLIYHCSGRIAITGVGKSADVGQKIAGTFNSTGTRAYVLDATRAVHGDLGMVHADDVILALSHSGESEELVRILGPLRSLAMAVVGLTSNAHSTLAREAAVAIVLGPIEEVCPLGLAPSTSTTAMIAVGDALAFVLSRMRRFTREDFARFHPAGSLGRKLLPVDTVMRRGADLRCASEDASVREVFAQQRRRGRRTGAVMLVDARGYLCGLFTDSDLARLIEERRESALDRPIREVMTINPITIAQGARVADAIETLRRHRISELPVVDADHCPIGLLDITDVLSLLPAEEAATLAQVA